MLRRTVVGGVGILLSGCLAAPADNKSSQTVNNPPSTQPVEKQEIKSTQGNIAVDTGVRADMTRSNITFNGDGYVFGFVLLVVIIICAVAFVFKGKRSGSNTSATAAKGPESQ